MNTTMLKITNDDNQLTNKVNKILNNDAENNAKKSNIDDYNSDLEKVRGALYSLLDEGNPDYEEYFKCLSDYYAKNKYTFIIEDNCGDDWVFDIIKTCSKFNGLKITYYSLSDILKMPYDVALDKLGNINLSEYEKNYKICNSLDYIEKLKHLTNCKFVITYKSDFEDNNVESFVYKDNRVAYMYLYIPEEKEYAERLNDFKDVNMSDVLFKVLHKDVVWENHIPSDEEMKNFIKTFWDGL